MGGKGGRLIYTPLSLGTHDRRDNSPKLGQSLTVSVTPRREAGGFLMSPSCLESHGCQFDPTFLYLSSLVILPSPVALSVLSFSAFGPILLICFSINLHFQKLRKVGSLVWLLGFFRGVRREGGFL